MSEIITGNKRGVNRKNRPQKSTLRVDFTPMVDMNMLLITFFMFCTTLASPQIMDVVLPTRIQSTEGSEAPESMTTTVILGENAKIYYFFGKAKYDDPGFLSQVKETDFSAGGIRKIFLEKNAIAIDKIKALSLQKHKKEITEAQFVEATDKIKESKDAQIVVIKPSDKSAYADLINMLDEVQICNISKYAITDFNDSDKIFMEKLIDDKSIAQARE